MPVFLSKSCASSELASGLLLDVDPARNPNSYTEQIGTAGSVLVSGGSCHTVKLGQIYSVNVQSSTSMLAYSRALFYDHAIAIISR